MVCSSGVPGAGDGPAGPGGPAEVSAAAQVFVADLEALDVTPEDVRHLARALRLRPGEQVVAADGRGRWRLSRYAGDAPGGAALAHPLEVDGPVVTSARPVPAVTVGFVPVKGDSPEWVVQKLTEIGVDRIVVLRSGRSVVRWDAARSARSIERLRRVARSAAAQSRRPWLPDIDGVLGLGELAAAVAPAPLALADPGAPPPDGTVLAVAVGPEGGWDDAERWAGYPRIGLGPTVLRAETAAMGAGLLLCGLRDGSFRPA
ncbi:MAG: RsmE family RNA methyltransferase [Acidimicrobiales bacterium]